MGNSAHVVAQFGINFVELFNSLVDLSYQVTLRREDYAAVKALLSVLKSMENGCHIAGILIVLSFLGIWKVFCEQFELGCSFFEKLTLPQQTYLKQPGSSIITCKFQRFLSQLNTSLRFGLEQKHAGEATTNIVIRL